MTTQSMYLWEQVTFSHMSTHLKDFFVATLQIMFNKVEDGASSAPVFPLFKGKCMEIRFAKFSDLEQVVELEQASF